MNPIVRRELLELLRTRKVLAAQVGLAAACTLLVLVRWPTGGVSDLSGARPLQVLRVFGYGLLAGVILLVPAFPATAARPREGPRHPRAAPQLAHVGRVHLRGQAGGVLGFAALLLLMTVPAAAACYALGGASAQGGVGLLYVVLAMASVQLATLALWVSGRSQSTDAALRATYALVLAVCAVPLAPHWLLQGDTGELADLAGWVRCLSPVPPVMEVLGHGGIGSHGMEAGGGTVPRYIVLAGLDEPRVRTLDRPQTGRVALDKARPAGVMTQDRSKGERAFRRLLFLVDPQRRSGHMGLWMNPVMVKEFRSRRFGRGHWTLRLIAPAAILSLGLSYIAAAGALGWGPELIGGALVLSQTALLLLFAPSLSAGLISTEREGGGWQLLRTTPCRRAASSGASC